MTGFPSPHVDVAGVSIYLQEWGDGRTLLCLHGLGGGAHFFAGLGQALAGRCHTVAFDFPGSGLSAPSAPFTFERAAQLVLDLFARQGWTAPVLLGHSMGTIVALEVVRHARDLVGGLVFAGGLPEPRQDARARLAQRIEEVQRHGMAGLGERVVMANFARRTQEERPELTALFARAFEMQRADAYIETAEALIAWEARTLPSLDRVPCLVITGDEDVYAPPEAARAFAQSLPPNTPFEVVRDAGHLPFLEQPAAFAEIVARFIARQ